MSDIIIVEILSFQAPVPETPLQQLPSPENRGNFLQFFLDLDTT